MIGHGGGGNDVKMLKNIFFISLNLSGTYFVQTCR